MKWSRTISRLDPFFLFQFLEYLLLRGLAALIRLVPFEMSLKIARTIGRALYAILKERRNIALGNLRAAYHTEKSEAEIKQIALQSFENLGMLAVEVVWMPKVAQQLKRFIHSEGEEHVRKALKSKKGVVLLLSHFGNWEWIGIATGAAGFPMNAVARPLKNPFVYAYIKKLRGLTGLKCVDKKGAARQALKLLAQNQVVVILIDQHERQGSVRVPFFGREASTTTLPAILALKRGALIVPLFLYRRPSLPVSVVYYEALPVIETGDYERDLFENTKQYVQFLEQEIRKQPGDWLWMHRRWRNA